MTINQLNEMNIEIECELPSRHVNEFTGTLKTHDDKLPLGLFNF